MKVGSPHQTLCLKAGFNFVTAVLHRRLGFLAECPWRTQGRITPLKRQQDGNDALIALCPQVFGPITHRMEKSLEAIITPVSSGVANGIAGCRMLPKPQNIEVQRSAAEPFTQP